MLGGKSMHHHRGSISSSKPHDKSFRVSKLATQIKDSVITSFGASRAITLSNGLSLINKNMNVVICKAFYKWSHYADKTDQTGDRPAPIKRARPTKNKLAAIILKNHLHRFAVKTLRMALYQWQKNINMSPSQSLLPEPELRRENIRLRRKSELLQPSEHSTMGLVRRRLSMVFSAQCRQSTRKAFDRWKSLSRIISYRMEMQRQQVKVEIGMQHIRSENKKISEVRAENTKLQSWLLCSIFFMRWKILDVNEKLSAEHDLRLKEREAIYKRVESLKKQLIRAQQIERDAIATAVLRGNEFCDRLNDLQCEFESSVAPKVALYLSSAPATAGAGVTSSTASTPAVGGSGGSRRSNLKRNNSSSNRKL